MTINAIDKYVDIVLSLEGWRRAFATETATSGSVIFQDGFTSGDITTTMGAARWLQVNTGPEDTFTVMTTVGNPGGAAAFYFGGNEETASDASVELRFDLGAQYTEVTIEFDMYVPNGAEAYGGASYNHRSVSPNNNKVLRLWPNDYADREKVGASFFANGGYSNINVEYSSAGGGIGVSGLSSAPFITVSDIGTWIPTKIQVKAPSSSAGGIVRIYKNGSLLIERLNLANYTEGELHSYRYGYLMGWSNSGFTSGTWILIDNVKFTAGLV